MLLLFFVNWIIGVWMNPCQDNTSLGLSRLLSLGNKGVGHTYAMPYIQQTANYTPLGLYHNDIKAKNETKKQWEVNIST